MSEGYSPPEQIHVHGRKGFNAPRINGHYKLRRQKVGDRVSYIKVNNECNKMTIWYWKERNVWMMTRLSMVGTESAYACVQQDVADPTLISESWNVYDKKESAHVPDKNLKMEAVTDDVGKEETLQPLKRRKKNLEEQIKQMQVGMEDLEQFVQQQEEETETYEEQKEEIIQKVDTFKEDVEKLEKQINMTQRRFRQLMAKNNSIQEDSKQLKKIIAVKQSTDPCSSFAVLESLQLDSAQIISALRNMDLEDVLVLLSQRENLCTQIQ